MSTETDFHLESYRQPIGAGERQRIADFLGQLAEERKTFQLTAEQILSAESIHLLLSSAGAVVGLAGLRNQAQVRLLFMVVAQPFQGRGCGKRLVEAVLANASSFTCVMLSVQCRNTRALELYRRYGFSEVTTHRENVFMVYRNLAGLMLYPLLSVMLRLRHLLAKEQTTTGQKPHEP